MPSFADLPYTELSQDDNDPGEATIVCAIDEPTAVCVALMKVLEE